MRRQRLRQPASYLRLFYAAKQYQILVMYNEQKVIGALEAGKSRIKVSGESSISVSSHGGRARMWIVNLLPKPFL
jgi:hypothetical protein